MGKQGEDVCGGVVRAGLWKEQSDICVQNRLQERNWITVFLSLSPTHLLLAIVTKCKKFLADVWSEPSFQAVPDVTQTSDTLGKRGWTLLRSGGKLLYKEYKEIKWLAVEGTLLNLETKHGEWDFQTFCFFFLLRGSRVYGAQSLSNTGCDGMQGRGSYHLLPPQNFSNTVVWHIFKNTGQNDLASNLGFASHYLHNWGQV